MRITVAICTWNRPRLLERTLDALSVCKPPTVPWELIVVNNDGTMSTSDVVAAFEGRLPVREVPEPSTGLSNARNTAVRSSIGDYIVWTDDDVLVSEAWLRAYEAAFERHPTADFFGGNITPWFEKPPPVWLDEAIHVTAVAYAVRDQGSREFRVTRNTLPFGANMAFRRSVLVDRPFNSALGRRGLAMLSGEELTVFEAILEAGGEGWWVPGAAVQHFISEDRMTVEYLRRFWNGNGRSWEVTQPATGRWWIAGSPAWLWKELLVNGAAMTVFHILRRPARWVKALRFYEFSKGRLAARLEQ